MPRTPEDCRLLTASVITSTSEIGCVMLLGYILGAYQTHTDSYLWHVVEEFLKNKLGGQRAA